MAVKIGLWSSPTFIVTDGDMSGNLTSEVITLYGFEGGFSLQAIYSGTPTGTLKLQGSLDETNYADMATLALEGSADNWLINVEIPRYPFVRMIYTSTSGTGTLNVKVYGSR